MIRMVLAVTCGGVIGTLLRFAISTWVSTQWPRQFYLATLAVNLIGCLLIGYLYATFLLRPEISPELRGAADHRFSRCADDLLELLAGCLATAGERADRNRLRLSRLQRTRRPAGSLGRAGAGKVMNPRGFK